MNLLNLRPNEAEQIISGWLQEHGLPKYRVQQILPRLWQQPARAWHVCSNLPKALIEKLNDDFPLPSLQQARRQESSDGTVKYLWELPDGATIESVLIPDGNRRTLCISSQVGCAFNCSFCATGKMGFVRNLAAWEIVGQVREMAFEDDGERIQNIVFMGMGEPLHNWSAVDVALTILNDSNGIGIGARKISVSTIGIPAKLKRLAARPEQFRLALSLHSPFGETRQRLMPVERRYPLTDVMQALKDFKRRVTFEYVLIRGVNDRADDIAELTKLAKPIGAMVNLLPLHPGGPPGLEPTRRSEIQRFAARLRETGIGVAVRRSRGLDIDAACGQLWAATARSGKVESEKDSDIEQQQ